MLFSLTRTQLILRHAVVVLLILCILILFLAHHRLRLLGCRRRATPFLTKAWVNGMGAGHTVDEHARLIEVGHPENAWKTFFVIYSANASALLEHIADGGTPGVGQLLVATVGREEAGLGEAVASPGPTDGAVHEQGICLIGVGGQGQLEASNWGNYLIKAKCS